ncbi:UNKNOWN [Stylonychia lemnae]|uniref:Uncharacterized protein n=1 Tax=Stylonychia lemnae TaxID=5949 RepID=A0A077ZZ48_STYLE|nr:UNKNOWN [Stylonychia lemnae]|eukprot:CDW75200.1 UNKNOWN [Stylonychia lemnae]
MAQGLCRYYFLTACLFLFLAIFCANFQNQYKDAVCVPSKTAASIASTGTQTTAANTTSGSNSTINQLVTQVLDLQLTKIPSVLIGFYATLVALNSIIFLILLYFSKFLPRDFAKMGRILNCIGALLKIFPKLMILLHYIICILILVIIGQVGNGSCKNSYTIDSDGLPKETKMQSDGVILVLILSSLWILMHFGGSIVRSMIYIDPFLADPYDPTANRFYRLICQTFGP